ncbi:MAG: C1 family peptidase, partial [Planctomycetota bacterium]
MLELPVGVDGRPRKAPGGEKKDLAAATPVDEENAAPAAGDGAPPPPAAGKAGGNADPQRTGCRKPTAEELAWMKANLVDEKVVKPNAFGLKRINAWRKKQGLKPVTLEEVARSRAARTGVAIPGLVPATSAKTMAPAELVGAAGVIDNSQLSWFPPIRTQGSQGSCAAFSTTYYTMTYMVARARGWDVTGTENTNKFSPKWTYNMINGGSDGGSWITTAYSVMQTNGCATWADFPYQTSNSPATNYRAWSTDGDVWLDALNCRMSTSGSISSMNTNTGINNLKDKLNDGYIVNY